MSILVTGCAGFIASKVTEQLLREGQRVVGVDNLNNAYAPRIKEWRLAQLQKKPGLVFHHLDISDREGMAAIFRENRFEAVINLAARAGVRQSVLEPQLYYATNQDGTLNLLELCRQHEVKKFVLASTSSLYGSHNPRPFREDADTSRPLSPYAASKKAAETLCYVYHYLHGLDITVLRYFTVYGPAGRPDMSVFRFVRWIAEGDPLTVFGDGLQERDFTYVDDIARGTIRGLKPVGFDVINLGSDHPVRLKYVIQTLEDLLGKKAKIRFQPAHPADVAATWADIAKARSLLQWAPEVTIEQGLEQAVRWYATNRDWAREVPLD